MPIGGCFHLNAVTTSAVDVITLSSDATIPTAAVTPPTRILELNICLKFVAQGDGQLVSLGIAARLSTMDVSVRELFDIGVNGSG